MIKSIKIGKLNANLVFRHKWEAESKKRILVPFRTYDLGIWFKKSKMVGKINFNDPKKWGSNLVGDYMFGINLLVVKIWISMDYNGMHGKI